MKIKLLSTAFALIMPFIFSSCSKESTSGAQMTAGIYYTCSGTMTFTIGTKDYSIPVISLSDGANINVPGYYGLTILAQDTLETGSTLPFISLIINNINVVSTASYTIPGNYNDMYTSINCALNDSSFSAFSTNSAATITITGTSATTVQGTFSGTLAPVDVATTSMIIKNGTFNCTY